MKYTIKDLAEGRCAVINDVSLYALNSVLREAKNDNSVLVNGSYKYYFIGRNGVVNGCDKVVVPTQSVKDFLKPSIQDKIDELKELAKAHGMECEVVMKERKRVEVKNLELTLQNFIKSRIGDYMGCKFKLDFELHGSGEYNADVIKEVFKKELEKYLNVEVE